MNHFNLLDRVPLACWVHIQSHRLKWEPPSCLLFGSFAVDQVVLEPVSAVFESEVIVGVVEFDEVVGGVVEISAHHKDSCFSGTFELRCETI